MLNSCTVESSELCSLTGLATHASERGAGSRVMWKDRGCMCVACYRAGGKGPQVWGPMGFSSGEGMTPNLGLPSLTLETCFSLKVTNMHLGCKTLKSTLETEVTEVSLPQAPRGCEGGDSTYSEVGTRLRDWNTCSRVQHVHGPMFVQRSCPPPRSLAPVPV